MFENRAYDNSFIVLIIAIAILFALYFFTKLNEKRKTFKENYKDYKETIMTIIIDEDEKIVERYYSYATNKIGDYMSIDEFYLKFDSKNLDKLKKWLSGIVKKEITHNIELVMYDEKNTRRVYMIENNKIDYKKKRIYLTFSDVTESLALLKRIDKANNVDNIDAFFGVVYEKIRSSTYDDYLIAIKYREFKDIKHALKGEFIQLIDSTIYKEIRDEKFDNDLLCIFEAGVILLCAFNVNNEKRLRLHIKKILSSASKTYTISKNQFSVTLVAGMRKVSKTEDNLAARVKDAIITCDDLIVHFIKNDRIKIYDMNLARKEDEKEMHNTIALNIVNRDKFTLSYKPFIDIDSNTITGYNVEIKLPALLNIKLDKFIKCCKEIGLRKILFTKVLNLILESKYCDETIYISINYTNLPRMMDAYKENPDFKKLHLVFCVTFNDLVFNYSNDTFAIQKEISKYKEEFGFKFGLSFNSLQTINLNDSIYEFCDCILLTDTLIRHCLDNYNNNLLLNMYVRMAKKYDKKLYVCQVNSLALYEFIYSIGANYVNGDIFDPYLSNSNTIEDTNFLARLDEAKSKKINDN